MKNAMKTSIISKAIATLTLLTASASVGAEPLPSRLAGTWRITRVLPVKNASACWDSAQAAPLVGTTITYREKAMRWRGGEVPVEEAVVRNITAEDFRHDNSSLGEPPTFAQLGIHAQRVMEVDLQHDDADITGATTEVPGDSVLLVAPNRIIFSTCGVYFEATRPETVLRASSRR